MTTAVLKIQKRVQSKVEAIELPFVNWKMIFMSGLLAMVLCLVFYALQINSIAGGSYLLSSYQQKISQLTDENNNLQVSFAESSFMGHAMQEAQDLNFEKTTSVEYINVPDDSYTAVNIK